MNLFRYIDFETVSSCNRTCPTCLRNSIPDRLAVQSWFEKNYLDIEIIQEALNQCVDLDFRGGVCLSHFNEPMMDERLPEIARMAHPYGYFLFMNSNGDFVNEKIARELDGVMDRIIFTLYMDDPLKSQRREWIQSLFHQTEIKFNPSEHIPSHYSPKFDLPKLISENIDHDCREPATRVIINHRRQFLLCCEDLIGVFGLGTFPETSIAEYWYGKHQEIHDNLLETGGRRKYAHCSICPKT